jgi:dihydroneopterin aldolase
MSDRVVGTGFSYSCRVGFHAYEQEIRQEILVDFEVETDWRAAARRDLPDGIVDYFEVDRALRAQLEGRDYQIIEAIAEDVARILCTGFAVRAARVKVTKHPLGMKVQAVAVECLRHPADYEGDVE